MRNESYKYSSRFFSGTFLYTSYLCAQFKMLSEELCVFHQQNMVSEPPGLVVNRNNGSDPVSSLPCHVSVRLYSYHCWAILVLTSCWIYWSTHFLAQHFYRICGYFSTPGKWSVSALNIYNCISLLWVQHFLFLQYMNSGSYLWFYLPVCWSKPCSVINSLSIHGTYSLVFNRK